MVVVYLTSILAVQFIISKFHQYQNMVTMQRSEVIRITIILDLQKQKKVFTQ